MKIVILGAKGMLGEDLGRVFSDGSPILLDLDKDAVRGPGGLLGPGRKLDITDNESVKKLLNDLRPYVVINAAAYTDVDGCETSRDLAMKVNGVAPGYIAAAAKNAGAIFVHYSTDYIFSGDKAEGYSEDDTPGPPINFYGESKLAGENAVREAGGSYYLIRTSWLFGLGGSQINGRPRNFIETILRNVGGLTADRGSDPRPIQVVNDQRGKPTFTLDLARRTREIIEGGKEFGIYHITNEPATTWYEFAKEIIRQGKNTRFNTSIKSSILPCASSEFPRPAKRPEYSILLNTKLAPMRPWQEALVEYLSLRD